jgi:hypothetical protein
MDTCSLGTLVSILVLQNDHQPTRITSYVDRCRLHLATSEPGCLCLRSNVRFIIGIFQLNTPVSEIRKPLTHVCGPQMRVPF